MIKTQQLFFSVLFMIVVFSNNFLMAQDADLKLLLDKTKAKGGICLILGAKDLSLAESLAKSTTFYSQVIQSDTVLATKWGLSVANSANRETIGIRNAVFDPEHYGSDLLNLIIIEDITVLGKIKFADLCRILVPNGYIAFKSSPVGFAEEAKTLEMSVQAVGSYVAVYNKPLKPFEWKICDSVKWKAGAGGVGECADIEVKNGTLIYADRFENEGDLNILAGQYIVRDAYNGRTLSSEPLGDRKPIWYAPSVAAALQPIKPTPKLPHEERGDAGGFMAIKARTDGKIDLPFFGGHCYKPVQLGKYIVYDSNIWVNTETGERTFPLFVHPACAYGLVPGNGIIYNFPSSKPQAFSGVTAQAPADVVFDHEPGGKILQTFGTAPKGESTTSNDWTMFRGNPVRGNSCQATLGDKLIKTWEVKLGLGTKSYGVMSGERTGLTQPVVAYGLVIVSDMDAERIVAVDAADGKQKWVFAVGSRVDFSPSLYNGLCLFAARSGWVYCLDARKGELIWKLLIPSRERLIGWQEKLGNLWPARSDVLIANGIGYASAGIGFSTLGGARSVAFKPETGEVVWSQCYHQTSPSSLGADIFYKSGWRDADPVNMGGFRIDMATGASKLTDGRGILGRSGPMDKYLDIGNSLPRTMADTSGYLMSDGKATGRVIAFSESLSVAYTVAWGGVGWGSVSEGTKKPVKMNLVAVDKAATAADGWKVKPLWNSSESELVVDDMVLTPKRIYCVGHYQRIKKDPEIWVVSREDGTVINTISITGYPSFMGMSAAGNNIFVATREGKLLCFSGEK